MAGKLRKTEPRVLLTGGEWSRTGTRRTTVPWHYPDIDLASTGTIVTQSSKAEACFTTKQELFKDGKNLIIRETVSSLYKALSSLGRVPSILEARAALFAFWRVTDSRLHT